MKIIYLYKKVLFPYCTITLEFKKRKHVEDCKPGDLVIAYPVKHIKDYWMLHGIGVLAEVIKIEKSDSTYLLTLKGLTRVRITKRIFLNHCKYEEIKVDNVVSTEMAEKIRKKAQELIFLINVEESDKLIHLLNFISDGAQLSDFIANYFILDYDKRVDLLNTIQVQDRILKVIEILQTLISNVLKKQEQHVYEKKDISR